MRRPVRIGLVVLGVGVVVAAFTVLLLTRTDFGREIIRRRIVAMLNANSHGIIRVRGISGNLLTEITLEGVSITDSAGRPLFLADTVASKYGLTAAIGRRVELSGLRLVKPLFVIEKFPGQRWNYQRIFPRDTVTRVGRRKTGWGTWIRFSDVTVVSGRLVTRVPWEPSALLSPREREAAITAALGVENRLLVERVPGGFWRVSDYRDIHAELPLVRLADPAHSFALIDVATLRTEAYPFRPPGVLVRALTGKFNFTGDSLWWQGMRAQLSDSRVQGDGRYEIGSGDLRLRLRGNPVNPRDIRWVFPELPRDGIARLEFELDWIGDSARYVARDMDVRMEGAHVRGNFGVTREDVAVIHRGTDLRFTGLRTAMLKRIFDIDIPRAGTLAGHAKFSGEMRALDVNGDVTFANNAGRSRIIGDGVIGFPADGYTFRDLRVRMLPVTADLARVVVPDMPFGGSFTGTATINGSTLGTVVAVGDVTHVEQGRRSRAIGRVAVRPGLRNWFDLNANMRPLAFGTVGRFAPELGLRGSGSGPLRLTGMLRDFNVNTSLAVSGGGDISLRGRLALGGRRPGYDLALDARLFNANAVSSRAPPTSLTVAAYARGVGADLATMRGTIVADVSTSTYDTVGVDSGKVRVTIANGLASFDTLAVHVPHGLLEARGTLGLVPQREGELSYRLAIDSLSAFAGLIGMEEGETPPRPLILARRLEEARSDSARIALATEVERAATGAPLPRLQVDTPRVVPRDVVAGSLRAAGVARGNIRRISLRGTASGEGIVARGNIVDRFTAEYDWSNVGTRDARISASAYAAGARVAGFEFDTVNVRVDHAASRGRADVTVRQDDRRTYAMNADYVLHADHDEVHLNQLRLQFDTTTWQSVRPATAQWGRRGIEIESLELTAGEGRRLFVDGLLPSEGEGDLRVVAENFEVGDIAAFLQSDVSARGLVSFDVRARGTAEDPSFTGTASGKDFFWAGTTFPRISGTFRYADETLTGQFAAARATGEPLVSAEGTIPVNLALQGVRGSRIPRDRRIALRVTADSFPVGIFPQLTRLVSNITARTSGSFTMGGTLRRPEFSGSLAISQGGARIVPLGIRVTNIAGSLTMTGDSIVIDSLAGVSGGGPVRLAGGIGVGSFREPSFNLQLIARNARLLNNDLGELKADVELTLYGPFADARLTGGVRLREGVLYMPEPDDKQVIGAGDPALFNVLDTAVAANKELFPAQSPLLANLEVDISVRVDRGVFVRSKDANVEVYSDGDLTLIADRAKEILKLDGILLSDRGDYVFLQKRFRIRRGSATFVGLSEINPTLQVTGEYEVRLPAREALFIQIIIGGTLLSPKIELRSTAQPPLSQSDLLSYLAFGRPSTSLTQLQGGALTGGNASGQLIGVGAALAVKQVATVALGVFTDEMAGEAAQSLGADVFIITPADVQTDVGNFLRGTEFEFGKYLRPTTFLALQARPDPESLRRPGFQLEHRFPRLRGYQLRLTLEPRYILREPTLADQEPKTRSAFGAFLIREWRY